MDLIVVHDKVSIISEEEDILSNLPDDIIHSILGFLDLNYAVQTCILSKRWKHIWTSMPYLNLTSSKFLSLPRFARFVNNALAHRDSRSEVSQVNIAFSERYTEFHLGNRYMDFVVNNIVKYAYAHNVITLSMAWVNFDTYKFPQHVFRSQTLKHLTLRDHNKNSIFPLSVWDFPVLETLNLSIMRLSSYATDRKLDLFYKCVSLKELTMHRVSMRGVKVFNICAPQLCSLVITDPASYPKVLNVVAPQLKNLTVSLSADANESSTCFHFLQLSTKRFDLLEKVNISLYMPHNKKEIYVPLLLSLFQKLRNVKFLTVDGEIVKTLSLYLDQPSHERCPFNNLKYLKRDTMRVKRKKDRISTIPTKVKNYLLENSLNATFITDIPTVRRKRARKQVHNDATVKKVVKKKRKLNAEKKKP